MKRKKRLKVGLSETTEIDEETDSDVAALVSKQKAPKTQVKMTGGNIQKMRPGVF